MSTEMKTIVSAIALVVSVNASGADTIPQIYFEDPSAAETPTEFFSSKHVDDFATKGFWALMGPANFENSVNAHGGRLVDRSEIVVDDNRCARDSSNNYKFWRDEDGHPATHICDATIDYSTGDNYVPTVYTYTLGKFDELTLGGFDVQYVSEKWYQVERRTTNGFENTLTNEITFWFEVDLENTTENQRELENQELKDALIEYHGGREGIIPGKKKFGLTPRADRSSYTAQNGAFLRSEPVETEGMSDIDYNLLTTLSELRHDLRMENTMVAGYHYNEVYWGIDRAIFSVTITSEMYWKSESPKTINNNDF